MGRAAVVCDDCGTSQLSDREPIRTGAADADVPEAPPAPEDRVETAYPALRMGRLRRTSQRHRRGRRDTATSAPPAEADPGQPATPAPPTPEEDMEPATIIARSGFDDVEDTPTDTSTDTPRTAGQRYVSEELEPPAEERNPLPPAPFEDRQAAPLQPRSTRKLSDPRPLTTVYGALDPSGTNVQRSVRLERRDQLEEKGDHRAEASWDKAAESQALVRRRSELKERFSGPDLDIEDAADEPLSTERRVDHARLTGGRRSDVGTKRLAGSPEDDLVMSEVAKQYSREYTGRDGWSPGAIADSVSYTFRVMGRTAGRTMAIRRLRKEREGKERIRADQLSELGEVALSLRDLDNALLDDYRSRLLELHEDQEMREDEVDSLNQQIETARRNHIQAERLAQTESDEYDSQIKQAEDGLRPVESSYRSALKAARSAEEDARALARQIDHARGELSRMSGAEAGGDEAARIKARTERWSSERDGLLREVPRLEEKAAALEPEIGRLRKEVDRSKSAQREHREITAQQAADHKREVQRLEGEVERIRVAIENIAGQRRALFAECGRQLDIDRPDHDHLEEIYGELDATAAEIRRFDHEIEIAQSKPEPMDFSALTRAAVALCGVVILVSLLIYAIS